jgi:DNA repair photolyase
LKTFTAKKQRFPRLTEHTFTIILGGTMPPAPVKNPPNPYGQATLEYFGDAPAAELEVYEDHTQEILAKNNSPDVGFRFSVNPYRGCMHACAYCYARPSHEYLSFGAGTDFDRKIVVKMNAAALLKKAFDRPSWRGDRVMFSGVTDCYQPLEASLGLTRACLEVCADYKNPAGVITKGTIIERDIDVLLRLASRADLHVTISIPIWDKERARAIEPYVPSPERRMTTIRRLAEAGLPVGINIAPMIPNISDSDIVELLQRAKDAGAKHAGLIFLRLPGTVKAVFEERLRAALPLRADRVLSLVRDARGGAMNDPRFGVRQVGEGAYAESVLALFETHARRLGLITSDDDDGAGSGSGAEEMPATFERPTAQLKLF